MKYILKSRGLLVDVRIPIKDEVPQRVLPWVPPLGMKRCCESRFFSGSLLTCLIESSARIIQKTGVQTRRAICSASYIGKYLMDLN